MLSVPYRFAPRPAPEFDAFRGYRAEMGGDCIGGGFVNSMVAMLCGMMKFEMLLEWVLAEPTLVKRLADEWLKRTDEKVKYLQEQGIGPFWHFNGVERASPPMMGPRQWEQLVVPYDGEIMRRIKSRDPQAIIHVHCHGRVGTLLDSFLALGVDSTDPLEPSPQGNVEFGAAKKRMAGRMTLFGNIEFVDMERCTPDEVEQKVRRAIEDGGKAHTILYPSATPHERASDKFLANARRYIEAGLKYGQL
jgi:uroporphyrinogen-III decarboxylase